MYACTRIAKALLTIERVVMEWFYSAHRHSLSLPQRTSSTQSGKAGILIMLLICELTNPITISPTSLGGNFVSCARDLWRGIQPI